MAYLQRLKKGWRVAYRLQGKIHYLSEHAGKPLSSKPLAELALAHAKRLEAAAAKHRPGTQLGIDVVIQRWQDAKLSGPQPNDEWSTKQAARRARNLCATMEWDSTAAITPAEITRWRKERPRSARLGAILRAILWWAKDHLEQQVADATLVALRPPRQLRKPEPPLMTPEQVEKLLAKARELSVSVHALLHALSIYGWRPITAAKMRVEHLVGDMIDCQIKGGDTIRHPLLPETLELLQPLIAGRKPGDPLFRQPTTGKAWKTHGTASIPVWCQKRLGFQVYDLKRYAISHLVDNIPLKDAQSYTGHRTLAQLLRYARTNEKRQRNVLPKLRRPVKQDEAKSADPAHPDEDDDDEMTGKIAAT